MQIFDLQKDLEVINPIESKTILGGDWYDGDYGYPNSIVYYGGGNSSSNGGWGDSYNSMWNDYYYGNGDNPNYEGGGGIDTVDYPGDLTAAETAWLIAHPTLISTMKHNAELASQYGQNQHNGVYDALRHALWSALDAHDIGHVLAEQFHTLHETENWNTVESPSDLNNNSWGYQWAYQNGDPETNMTQFIHDFNIRVASGEITVIP